MHAELAIVHEPKESERGREGGTVGEATTWKILDENKYEENIFVAYFASEALSPLTLSPELPLSLL